MEIREDINQIGCMWLFMINLFGSNHKRLLMSGSKRVSVNEKMLFTCSNEKMLLTCSNESSQESVVKKDIDVSIESEEPFSEMIKRLIAYKEGEIQTCKDLLEAFEEESFLKKLVSHQDAQSLGDSKRVEEEESFKKVLHQDVQSLGDSKRVEEEEVVIQQKKGKFFSKKWKSRRERSQDPKTIVVLKPGPNLDVESSTDKTKSKNMRRFSQFLISLIKRRLQSKKPKPSCDVSLEEESESKSEDTTDSKNTMSGLYIAAKKHLSEMLANGDIDVSLSDKEVPRILGKILSLPEFSSPVNSPRLITEHDLVSHLNPLSQTTEEPKPIQCSSASDSLIDDKQEEILCTIDVSVPTGCEKETEDLDKEEKTENEIVPSSETCISSISQQVELLDEDVLELHEEEEDKQSSKKEMLSEVHSLTSPPESPPRSSVSLTESKEPAIDVQGKLSPVSVLEPLFTDDDSSPTTSTRFTSAEMRIQPLRIRFEETDSPKPNEDNIDDLESTLTYIEAIVKSSSLNWEELLTRPFYSNHLLLLDQESTTQEDIIFSSTHLCEDKNLLQDCINEVLIDFCCNELNPGPWISFLKPEIQLVSDKEIATKVAQEGVYWHLQALPSPHTLDQIVRKDMARIGSWMDLRVEIGCVGSFTGELILDELVEEVIRSYEDMNCNNM